MQLRDAEGRPALFLFMGMWWSAAIVLDSAAWPLLPAMAGALLTVRRWSVEEGLSGIIGVLSPFLLTATMQWLVFGQWDGVLHSGRITDPLPPKMYWTVLPVGLGWAVRQQSLVRATAQQRFARQLTQWSSGLGLTFVALAFWIDPFAEPFQSNVLGLFPGMLAFGAAWCLPWLMPPGYRITAAMPYLFLSLSLLLLLTRFSLVA
jgi:hypothetical protein